VSIAPESKLASSRAFARRALKVLAFLLQLTREDLVHLKRHRERRTRSFSRAIASTTFDVSQRARIRANRCRPMQRWQAGLFAVCLLGVGAFAVWKAGPSSSVTSTPNAAPSASATASAAIASTATVPSLAEPVGVANAANPGNELDEGFVGADAGGALLLSGERPPALAADAPKSVTWGVVLVVYQGAQLAPTTARSREAALVLAKELAEVAKTDFKAAVAKGDKGSMDNAGKMPRGVLEPAPEFVLFSLKKDEVSGPVDTPRGFWIVRRIE
jgi:hypothetical protein